MRGIPNQKYTVSDRKIKLKHISHLLFLCTFTSPNSLMYCPGQKSLLITLIWPYIRKRGFYMLAFFISSGRLESKWIMEKQMQDRDGMENVHNMNRSKLTWVIASLLLATEGTEHNLYIESQQINIQSSYRSKRRTMIRRSACGWYWPICLTELFPSRKYILTITA